jgi:hypothetical protein
MMSRGTFDRIVIAADVGSEVDKVLLLNDVRQRHIIAPSRPPA